MFKVSLFAVNQSNNLQSSWFTVDLRDLRFVSAYTAFVTSATKKNIGTFYVHKLFWMLQWSAIYYFNPKLRLSFVRNWVLLYINENENHCAKLIRSPYYRFTFLCLSFRHLVQNKQIVKVLWISTHQTLLTGKTRRFQGFFMIILK